MHVMLCTTWAAPLGGAEADKWRWNDQVTFSFFRTSESRTVNNMSTLFTLRTLLQLTKATEVCEQEESPTPRAWKSRVSFFSLYLSCVDFEAAWIPRIPRAYARQSECFEPFRIISWHCSAFFDNASLFHCREVLGQCVVILKLDSKHRRIFIFWTQINEAEDAGGQGRFSAGGYQLATISI